MHLPLHDGQLAEDKPVGCGDTTQEVSKEAMQVAKSQVPQPDDNQVESHHGRSEQARDQMQEASHDLFILRSVSSL